MKQIVELDQQYQYSREKWDSIISVVVTEEQKRANFIKTVARGNPPIDNNVVKGYN